VALVFTTLPSQSMPWPRCLMFRSASASPSTSPCSSSVMVHGPRTPHEASEDFGAALMPPEANDGLKTQT
jgi:hypothetical protein